ncbi:hypothetical protein Y1Q_0019845 [Alligator mississippiensis]|uniref:Uncharacterized protein n=1 Tax=Alligator mississippiensis TaxID=8496 RepID=A0A151PFI6_ALLMI|nr:hypothetical protein Y1Q_0019845 [Alligator mississippiensis]
MESSSLQASCPQKWTPALLFASECAKDQRSYSSWFYPCRPVIADDAIGWLQLDKDVADEPRGFLSPFQLSVAPAVALIAPDGHHLPFSKLSGCLLDS